MWSRSDQVGSGVKVTGVDRMVDPLLDLRARTEHGKQAWLDQQSAVLARVETGIAEPGDTGVAAAIAGFRSALHDLANAPDSDAARGQVLAHAPTRWPTPSSSRPGSSPPRPATSGQTLVGNVAEVNQVAPTSPRPTTASRSARAWAGPTTRTCSTPATSSRCGSPS